MSEGIHLDVRRPFGPSLGKVNIPESLINKINNYIDEIIDKDKIAAEQNDYGSSLAGQVKQEIRLPKNIVEGELLDYLISITKTYIKISCEREITKFELMSTWVVRQFENEYNPAHVHGGHVSGAGYLKLPESFGNPIQEKKPNVHGHINFINGTKQFLSSATLTEKPKVGDFYIFPHYLFHSVNPFTGSGERRSLSFNAKIDEEIFSVHSHRTKK